MSVGLCFGYLMCVCACVCVCVCPDVSSSLHQIRNNESVGGVCVCVCVRARLRMDCVGYACGEAVRLEGLTVLVQGLGSPWIIFT